ncbi:hypothetical protein [Mucilaginibacter ginkgonis]|uniref:Small multidrug resistance family-3 protein n=1 Tax=Mucilaginibacter ginkgonis TaxID=2682091 RepID=A0A6I4I1R0_9SPHI|nr:hypothetical protein [Mucilaginibacter ginkgonis]QQL50610.1 hypothetical protein GO620_003905 [Mucilaginibacter ginkgonis]
MKNIHPIFFLIIATALEVSGDAIIRRSIYNETGTARIAWAALGAILVFAYGVFLNLAPLEFGKVVGLYIATLFVMWQIITYISTKEIPSMPVLLGGLLIVSGGLIVSFWKTA